MTNSLLTALDDPVHCGLPQLIRAWQFVGSGLFIDQVDAQKLVSALPQSLRRMSEQQADVDDLRYLTASHGVARVLRTPEFTKLCVQPVDEAIRSTLLGLNLALSALLLRELLESRPERLPMAESELRWVAVNQNIHETVEIESQRISLSGLAFIALCCVSPENREKLEYQVLRNKTVLTLRQWLNNSKSHESARRFLQFIE